LSDDIHAFAQKIGAQQDLTVVVISDHGSTRIPRGITNVIQGNFYKQRTLDEHHRYVAISDQELEKLPQNYAFDCYLLKREMVETGTNFLAAAACIAFCRRMITVIFMAG
jgi:hypothetical protein